MFNKKKILAAAMILTLTASLMGCGDTSASDSSGRTESIVYTNMADEASKKEVIDALKEHGISEKQADTLSSWIDDFNERVSSGQVVGSFTEMEETGADYSDMAVEIKEDENGEILPEANCRLSAYLLIKNQLETNGTTLDDDTFLMFDIEAIDNVKQFNMNNEERTNFISLFNWIPLDDADTLEKHIEKIQNAWKDREIKVKGDGISLITVYLHSEFDNARFAGHTGVLLENGDNLMFVEKYGPGYPFQAAKFSNRSELKEYLLGRPDLYGEETELEPIVMENGELL